MRRLLAGLLIAGALAAPATAAADSPPWLTRAIAVADAHWPASPCKGREVVIPADQATIDQFVPGAGSVATSWCRVFVNWGLWAHYPARHKCRMLEHEFGHLAGHGHSLKPASVMFPIVFDVGINSLDCVRAFPAWSDPTEDQIPGWRQDELDEYRAHLRQGGGGA